MYDLFDGLTNCETEELKELLPSAIPFKKGDELYKNGYIAFIKSGTATVKRISATGQITTVRTVKSGELFGSASLYGEWKQGASSILADDNGTIIYISEKQFSDILNTFPKASENYIKYLTDKIRFLNRRIDAFSACSTEQRLYEYLSYQKDENNTVTLNISMTKLALLLNVGRTSLYRDMQTLEKKGLIKKIKKTIIIN